MEIDYITCYCFEPAFDDILKAAMFVFCKARLHCESPAMKSVQE